MSTNRLGHSCSPGLPGIGKTEVTVQLAKALGIELLRFDMSEYMERHTVSVDYRRLRATLASIRAGC